MSADIKAKLHSAGLRPTRQRVRIGELLFDGQDKHVTAEALHAMVKSAGESVSLATIYNTLNAFLEAGLLRQVTVDSGKVYFDTHVNAHYHLYDQSSGHLTDINAEHLEVSGIPELPPGKEIDRIDVIIRLKDK